MTVFQKVIRLPAAPRMFDPARDAARLLGWTGMSVLMVAAPLAGVLSRRSLFVLLPIGAGLLFAAFLIAVSSAGLRAFRSALLQPAGLSAGFLFVWAALSLVWTPFPGDVASTLIASLATVVLATLIIAHLPERRVPTPALYLLPGGLMVTALTTLGMALFGPATFRGGSEFDPSLLERSVLTLVVLLWPALGALAAFGRWRLAMALSVLVAGTIAVAGAPIAMAVFVAGAVTFAAAVTDAPRTARRVAWFFAGLILIAPVLPFGLAPLAASIAPVGKSTVAAMADWRALVSGDGLRLVTGHGIGTAGQGVGLWLPAHTPRTTLFEIWYELGSLGALSLAATIGLGLRAAGRAAVLAAPALIAGMVVTIAIAVFGVATAQVWFVTLASLQAVAFGLLCRSGRHATAANPSSGDGPHNGLRPKIRTESQPGPPAAATVPHI